MNKTGKVHGSKAETDEFSLVLFLDGGLFHARCRTSPNEMRLSRQARGIRHGRFGSAIPARLHVCDT